MRRSPDRNDEPHERRWLVRWLNARSEVFYLFAAILVTAAIIAFTLWLEPDTVALVAAVGFFGLAMHAALSIGREWRDTETGEKALPMLVCLALLFAAGANLVRYMLLS